MHVRGGRYIGVAPVPGGLANVCLVTPLRPGEAGLGDPASVLRRELARDAMLRDRFMHARLANPPVVLGPLAVDVERDDVEGLLLAGDAAGFVDPITGDGLRFAIRGGELAAIAALEALEHGWAGVHGRLAARRRRDFRGKYASRFRATRLMRVAGITFPWNGSPVAGSLITESTPLRVRPEKSPRFSASVGSAKEFACGWLSTYFSPANQKNVLFLTIGPPPPPPPLRQYSGTFGWPSTFGISNWPTYFVGRITV